MTIDRVTIENGLARDVSDSGRLWFMKALSKKSDTPPKFFGAA